VKASNAEDMNSRGYLERVTKIVMQNLRHIGGPPGIQMTGTDFLLPSALHDGFLTVDYEDIPHLPIDELMDDMNADEDLISPDERRPQRILDARRQAEGELSDSDDEGEGGRRNHADEESGGGGSHLKFGIGVGIMSSGQRNIGGVGGGMGHSSNSGGLAGPSGLASGGGSGRGPPSIMPKANTARITRNFQWSNLVVSGSSEDEEGGDEGEPYVKVATAGNGVSSSEQDQDVDMNLDPDGIV
jgi:hypothetical protein